MEIEAGHRGRRGTWWLSRCRIRRGTCKASRCQPRRDRCRLGRSSSKCPPTGPGWQDSRCTLSHSTHRWRKGASKTNTSRTSPGRCRLDSWKSRHCCRATGLRLGTTCRSWQRRHKWRRGPCYRTSSRLSWTGRCPRDRQHSRRTGTGTARRRNWCTSRPMSSKRHTGTSTTSRLRHQS